jgi:hypothetical protein
MLLALIVLLLVALTFGIWTLIAACIVTGLAAMGVVEFSWPLSFAGGFVLYCLMVAFNFYVKSKETR